MGAVWGEVGGDASRALLVRSIAGTGDGIQGTGWEKETGGRNQEAAKQETGTGDRSRWQETGIREQTSTTITK